MAQKISRNAPPVRRQARRQNTRNKVQRVHATTGSLMGAVVRILPVTEEQLHRMFLIVIFAVVAVAVWSIASLAGLTALAHQQFASAAAEAGFEVRRVEVHGADRINKLKVYERVLGERNRAMPLVDLGALRDSLSELSWVADARVSRRLPDTIVVNIVERVPHAVLRRNNRLVLIDATGAELEAVSRAEAKDRLVLTGDGVQAQVGNLDKLLDAAPALRPQIAEAAWVGNRRWDLTFKTGQSLALPKGANLSATALIEFARLDGVNRLLGGKVLAFDMRSGERIYFRCPECREEDAAAAAATKES